MSEKYLVSLQDLHDWYFRSLPFGETKKLDKWFEEHEFHEKTCKRRNHDTDNYYMRCYSCSECNAGWFEDIYDKPFSYCPHCGAKVVKNASE